MNDSGCALSNRERLFILEIYIECVRLYADKFDKIEPSSVGVDLNFIDFPLFRVFQSDFLYTKVEKMKATTRDAKYRIIHFNGGKIELFPYNPAILVKKMRETPVNVDVYKIKEIVACPEGIDKEPLGETQFPLPGCLCNTMLMAGNDYRHLPRAYEIKNTFNLVNVDRKPSGVIALSIKLTCYGDFIGSHFAFVEKTLVFKNIDITTPKSYDNEKEEDDIITLDEYHCFKVPMIDEEEKRADERERKICLPHIQFDVSELDLPPRPQNVAGLVSICDKLFMNDGLPQTTPNIFKTQKEESDEILIEERIDPACVCSPIAALFKFEDESTESSHVGCEGGLCIGSNLLYRIPKNYEYVGSRLQSCPRYCAKCSRSITP